MNYSFDINLPEGFRLVSVHTFHTGEWIVCICETIPGQWLGLHYGSGQASTIPEAVLKALTRCQEARDRFAAPRAKPQSELLSSLTFNL